MPRGDLSMRQLGQMGRFANQLVQYAFVKTYARRHDLTVRLPPWIGNDLFGARDLPLAEPLPTVSEPADKQFAEAVIPNLDEPLKDVDVEGFFQYPSSYYAPDREYLSSLFTPAAKYQATLDADCDQLRKPGGDLVAIHVRRGDYGYSYFYLTPTEWYVRWLDVVWPRLNNPVLYVATDEPHTVARDFARFSPKTARDLGVKMPAAPYYPDFYVLSQADVLAIPNSTFSFVASMLNRKLREAWRSHLSDPVEDLPFRRYDPWNADFLETSATVEQYPHIPGIAAPPKPKKFRPWRPVKRWLQLLFRSTSGIAPSTRRG